MLFKRSLLTLIVAGQLLGCAGEKDPYSEPINIKFDNPKFNCLANADTIFESFIAGTLPDEDLLGFWNCLDLAVVQFVKYVRGKEGLNYGPVEIAGFVDKFFLGGRGLDKETVFLQELMQVKRIFVGGRLDLVSHYELIVRTRDIIRQFSEITLQLNPHMRVISVGLAEPAWKSLLTERQVNEAIGALRRAGLSIGGLIEAGRGQYSFGHLKALIVEIEKFLQKDRPGYNLDRAKKYLPLLGEIKSFLVAPPNDLINSRDWAQLFDKIGSVLGWVMKYHYYLEGQDWTEQQPLSILSSIIGELFTMAQMGADAQEAKTFSFLDLNRLLDHFDALNMIPLGLSVEAAKDTVRHLGTRVFEPGGTMGLDKADIRAFQAEVSRWLDAQAYINQYVAGDTQAQTGGAREMFTLIDNQLTLKLDSLDRIQFSPQTLNSGYDRWSLTTLNWQRAVIRALMRGFTTQNNPDGAASLTQAQLTSLAEEFQVLAIDLGLFTPGKAEERAKKILMESSLFLPVSNGDARFDFNEGVQYIAFVMSGLHGGTLIRDTLETKCGLPDAPKLIEAQCLRSEVASGRADFMSQFPVLLTTVGRDEGHFRQFESLVETALRGKARTPEPFARGDLVEVQILIHYIEAFLARFDSDGSQTINVDESIAAFPVFKRALGDVVKSSFGTSLSDDDLLALFTFLFKYGEPPQSSFGGIVKFLNWKWDRSSWQYEAGRMRVIEILAQLNSRSS